jgi:hypothetical protein
MESKELRTLIAAKIEEKRTVFESLKKQAEEFCVKILVDSKDILNELPTLRTIIFLGIDEIDDRVNSGLLDPIDAPIAKGLLDKIFFNTGVGEKAEMWYTGLRNRALEIITKETESKASAEKELA